MGSVNPPETYPVVPPVENSAASRTDRTINKVSSSLLLVNDKAVRDKISDAKLVM